MMDQNDFLGVGYYFLINFRAKFAKLSPVETQKIRKNAKIVIFKQIQQKLINFEFWEILFYKF